MKNKFFLILLLITSVSTYNISAQILDTVVEYVRINAPDPALAIGIPNTKAATIDRDTYQNQEGKNLYWGETESGTFMGELEIELQEENIIIVERGSLLGKILGELNLGSSELAHPDSRLKLGKIVLAGFYIITKYTRNTAKTTYNFRVVHTVTGEIVYANTLSYFDYKTINVLEEAKNEASIIIAALEKFATEKALIIKENPKRYSK